MYVNLLIDKPEVFSLNLYKNPIFYINLYPLDLAKMTDIANHIQGNIYEYSKYTCINFK